MVFILWPLSIQILLADVIENFQNICFDTYKLNPAGFLTASGLAWQAALRITKIKLDLLTDICMLLMVQKGIRGGICYAFQWFEERSKLVMSYNDDSDKGYFLENDVQYPENLHNLHNDFSFFFLWRN